MRRTLPLLPGLALPSLLLLAPVAEAAPSPPSGPSAELLTNETRRQVTDEVKRFLEERCPQQCDVGEVTVKVGNRKPPVGATPGFEELAPDVKDYVVERVDVNLMLDKRLTNDFRTGVRQILAKKLEAEGMSNVMHEVLIHFPTAQELPEKPPLAPQQPPAQAAKEPEKKPEPTAQPQPPQIIQQVERSAWDRFLDELPLLLGLALCAGVVWFTLRQYQRILETRTEARRDEEAKAVKAAEPETRAHKEAAERREIERGLESLRARLDGNRPLAREVMRDLLQTGTPADGALAVALLGPDLLDGVRGDADCRPGLDALDGWLADRAPDDTTAERRRILGDMERRLLRVQVARGGSPVETAFTFLREVPLGLFVRLLEGEPSSVQAILLRQAPRAHVRAFLDAQPAERREQLVRPLLVDAAAPRSELDAIAQAFREKVSRHSLLDGERRPGEAGGEPLGDLLQAATPDERRRLLRTVEGDPRALKRALSAYVDERALALLDADVLATAIARLDVHTAAELAASLDEVARKRLLGALPQVTARALDEELDARHAQAVETPARVAARRAALASIRRAAEERGIDLAEINRRAIVGEEVA